MSRLPAFNQPENMPADGASDVYSGSPIEPPAVTVTAAATEGGEVSSGRPSGLEEIHDDDIAQPIPFNFAQFEDDGEKKRADVSVEEEKEEEEAIRPSGLEEIHDDEDAQPMPLNSALFEDADEKVAASTSAQQSRRSGLEEINDDEDAQPMPFNSIQFEDDGGKKKRAAASVEEEEEATRPSGLEELDDDAPLPFNSAHFEDDAEIKKRAALSVVSRSEVISSLPTPTAGVSDDGAREHDNTSSFNTTTQFEEDEGEDTNVTPTNELYDEEAVQVTRNNNTSSQGAESVDNYAGGIVDSSVQVIPHAYLVDDDDDDDNIVVAGYAELLPPWWKQRRTRGMFAAIVLVLLTAAIAIGILVSRKGNTGVGAAVFLTNSPTQSNAPSSTPSGAPSDSVSPSSSPTKCSDTIAANAKEVDLNVLVGGLKNPKVAIDGNNMVVVANDSTGYAYTIFFKRGNSGEWTRTRYFIEECERTVDDAFCSYSVALSGNTALVGSALVGLSYYSERKDQWIPAPVSMYRRSDLEQWDKIDSLLVPEGWEYGSFGQSVGIDGDLICVVADLRSSGIVYPRMFIFRSISEKWEQVGIEGFRSVDGCDVSGDTIMAFSDFSEDVIIHHYQFDREDNVAVPIQGDFRIGEESYVSGSRLDGNHIVYSTYHLTWNVAYDRVENFIGLFIYKRSDNDQQFRLQQRLEASDYEEGFGRTFDVQDDALVVGGNHRTFIFLDHGDFFEESIILDKAYTSINLSRRNVIATTEANRVESFVILEDCTQLVPTQTPSLSTSPSFTQSPSSVPSAFVTYGHTDMAWLVLVDDGSGRPLENTIAPTSNGRPRTSSPTTSQSPSLSPSLSLPPTEKCFVINIAFTYDSYPEETRWKLLKLDQAGGDDTVIKSYRPSSTSKDKSYREDMCLEEGRYQFIVTDWDGTKSYNVSSYGDIIVQGGKFDREETRIFDLPYDSNLAPSQSPSASSAPSIIPTKSLDPTKKPSLAPSNSQVPSQRPSLSLLPTETCFWLKLMVTFDEYETETTWKLLLTTSSSVKEYIFVNSAEPLEGVYDGSLCLPEGQYKFTIYDSAGDGICCNYGEGSYSLTSYGEVIVQGGAFGAIEMTTFDIPHDPSSVITESTTAAPIPTFAPTPIF